MKLMESTGDECVDARWAPRLLGGVTGAHESISETSELNIKFIDTSSHTINNICGCIYMTNRESSDSLNYYPNKASSVYNYADCWCLFRHDGRSTDAPHQLDVLSARCWPSRTPRVSRKSQVRRERAVVVFVKILSTH